MSQKETAPDLNCVVAVWEGDLDYAKAEQVLDGAELVDVTAGQNAHS